MRYNSHLDQPDHDACHASGKETDVGLPVPEYPPSISEIPAEIDGTTAPEGRCARIWQVCRQHQPEGDDDRVKHGMVFGCRLILMIRRVRGSGQPGRWCPKSGLSCHRSVDTPANPWLLATLIRKKPEECSFSLRKLFV